MLTQGLEPSTSLLKREKTKESFKFTKKYVSLCTFAVYNTSETAVYVM